MKLIDVYSDLRKLGLHALQTQDVAAHFGISVTHASKLLSRLAMAKQIVHLARGVWVFKDIDPLSLPQFLTAPFSSYISLQTALYYYGMISQIPSTIYAVSLARTRMYKTLLANVSVHHVQPEFFFGYELREKGMINMATPEKALIDLLYLSQGKTRLFRSLPELEFPKKFKVSIARDMIKSIPSARLRTIVEVRFNSLLQQHK